MCVSYLFVRSQRYSGYRKHDPYFVGHVKLYVYVKVGSYAALYPIIGTIQGI